VVQKTAAKGRIHDAPKGAETTGATTKARGTLNAAKELPAAKVVPASAPNGKPPRAAKAAKPAVTLVPDALVDAPVDVLADGAVDVEPDLDAFADDVVLDAETGSFHVIGSPAPTFSRLSA